MVSSYSYTSLHRHQIRLLKLEDSALDTAGLSCTLEPIEFDDNGSNPAYQALSYTWGDPAITVPITVNGSTREITTNLSAALTRLVKSPEPPKYLWVDALCINQQDNSEKAIQVRKMRSIYSRAEKVIVWLGDEVPSDYEAIAVLTRMREWGHGAIHLPYFYAMMAPFGALTGSADDKDDQFLQDQLATSDPRHPTWAALNAIFARPWFSRMWVIQEFVCARECTYLLGDMELEHGLDFITAPIALSMTESMSAMRPGKLKPRRLNAFFNATELGALQSAHERDGLGSLYDVLARTYGFNATNPLDRVFAVIGLLNEEQRVQHEGLIDYDQTPNELLIKIAKDFILPLEVGDDGLTTPGLNLLSHIIRSDIQPHGLPSWVPEWRFKDGFYVPLCSVYDNQGRPPAQVRVASDNTLHVRGYVADRIVRITPSPYAFPQTQATNIYDWIMSLRSLLAVTDTAWQPCQPPPESVKRALICNSIPPHAGSQGHKGLHDSDLSDFDTWFEGHRLHKHLHVRILLWLLSPGTLRPVAQAVRRFKSLVATSPTLFMVLAYLLYVPLVSLVLCYWASGPLVHFVQQITGGRAGAVLTWICTPLAAGIYGILESGYKVFVQSLTSGMSQYGMAFATWAAGRSFCVTSEGNLGWVPDSAHVGDQIVVLKSASIAFTMRELSDGRLEVVGDAYIHDLMEGAEITYTDEREVDIVIV